MYSKEDHTQLELLFKKVINSQAIVDEVYMLYKKYINDKAPPPTKQSCCSSVVNYFNELRDWYVQNGNKFNL